MTEIHYYCFAAFDQERENVFSSVMGEFRIRNKERHSQAPNHSFNEALSLRPIEGNHGRDASLV